MIGELFEAFGAAIGDIRQKLVEEGWFGRTVTDRPTDAGPTVTGWDMPRDSFDEQWAVKARDTAPEITEPERDGPDMDF